ncbi:methyl-accepting chemotaxis protein [Terasakiella sp. A23]|uniref:methyl-accepting chemotaxis protein n=1 Tax=Terasakiella sp. FCG-A23 TaxID=3080561 RepID=UPI002953B875|nr:methyl-accepting chemotaxis protein [Terasakiella sp. A23]MDV7338523.1 methyl-accepting chemotaxis protein [Terasakiella sp. A23]
MTIRTKLIGAFALMLAFVMVNSALLLMIAGQSSDAFDEISASSNKIKDKVLPLITVTQDLKVNVIQVQQWLTDISATRGLDGLNDGFDEAKANADEFKANLAVALKLTEELNQPKLTASLKEMGDAFGPYYQVGVQMAEAYIADGPAGGNKMMGNFDEVAAKIQDGVGQVNKGVKAIVKESLTEEGELLAKDKEKNNSLRNVSLVPIVISVLVGFAAIIAVTKLCKNISQMTATMTGLSQGKLDTEVHGRDRSDELGEMAESVQIFKESAIENKRLQDEQKEAEEKVKKERQATMMQMADDLEGRVSGSMQEISDVLTDLEGMAGQMSSAADQTSAQSQAVSAATEEATANVEAVSASGAQLTASINEISEQVAKSSEISSGAVAEAQETTQTISTLAEEVGRIGDVVKLITDIAEQTNMLALNATIEAARAGDAGKGFAVVASEVKNLAQQTAKATEEIGAQIGKIQSETTGAVDAIDGIATTIGHLNEYTSSIAAAVEEQSAATGEIAHNVNEAARGNEEVSSNISGVAQAASDTGRLAHSVADSANNVKNASQHLRSSVQEFLDDIRDGSSGNIRF